jgi:hypothetical protein
MPAVITNNFRLLNARNFVDSFPVSANSSVYLYIGRTHSWDSNPNSHAPNYSDQVIPPPVNSFKHNDYVIWNTITSLVQLSNTDVSFSTKKVTWASGTVYEKWDDNDSNLVNLADGKSEFFVINSGNQIFKCLNNNGGAPSLNEPLAPDSPTSYVNPFATADEYVWKFMYQIPTEYNTKFTMNNYIPVRTLTEAERAAMSGTDPWIKLKNVQDGAIPGTIDSVTITSEGSGYPGSQGNIGSVTNDGVDFVLTLVPDTSALWDTSTNKRYGNSTILISNSTFATGATVKDSTASPKTVKIDNATADIIIGLAHEYIYTMGPEVRIVGDGTAGLAAAIVSVPPGVLDSSGPVVSIQIANTGYGYTFADLEIIPVNNERQTTGAGGIVPPAGQAGRAVSILSPPGGHGSDPVRELSAYHVAISTELVNEGYNNTLIVGSQDYRQIGLIKDAKISGGAYVANAAPGYDQTLRIVANTSDVGGLIEWTPTLDEMLIGATSNATGIVVDYNQIAITDSIIRLTGVRANTTAGIFEPNELLHPFSFDTGKDELQAVRANTMGIGGTGGSIIPTDLDKYTGSIIYNENRSPISRTSDQKEDIKVLVEF